MRVDVKEKKIRGPRKAFFSLQVEQLKRRFRRNQYPNRTEHAELAASLGLTIHQV